MGFTGVGLVECQSFLRASEWRDWLFVRAIRVISALLGKRADDILVPLKQ